MRFDISAKESRQEHDASDECQQHDDGEPDMSSCIYQFQQEVGEHDQHQQVKKE